MAAIKAFFKQNRASKLRSATVVPVMEPQVVVTKNPAEEKLDSCSVLLERDWFVDYDDLLEFLYSLEPEVIDYAYSIRQKYPDRVQGALVDTFMWIHCLPKAPIMSVKDITDQDLFKIEQDIESVAKQEFNEAWKNYKIANGISRGVSSEEEDLHVLDMMLSKEKEALAEYKKKTKRTYVPPSKLKNSEPPKPDANETKILTKIENLENEIKALQKRIAELDNLWEELQKNEFAKQYYTV